MAPGKHRSMRLGRWATARHRHLGGVLCWCVVRWIATSSAGSAPKHRTAVFRGKYDRGVSWVFCGESRNDPGHRPWVLSRVVASGGPEGEARRRSPKAKPEGEARRRSATKKPTNFIIATKTPHTHKHRKQRTAHREPRRHARDNSEQPRRATGDCNPTREPRRDRRRDRVTRSEAQLDEGVVPTGTHIQRP